MSLFSFFTAWLPAADGSALAARAQKAAVGLPKGCIVTAEQTGDAAPVVAVAGQLEPAGVAPGKVIFEIGSISKVFTGLLLAQAVIDKRVRLDATLREALGAKQVFADEKVAGITLLQLATHTSGLPRLPDNGLDALDLTDPYAHYDRAALDAYLAAAKLEGAPPFPTEYSNLGMGLLGDVLARVYGRTWEDLVVEFIAAPLGLQDTRVTLNEAQQRRLAPPYTDGERVQPWTFQAMAGAGALRSTAEDLLKFGQALAQPGRTPLKEAIELAVQPRAGGETGLALQLLKVRGQNSYWHNGGTGGFSSWLSVKPAIGQVVVVLINNGSLAAEAVLSGTASKKAEEVLPADPVLADFIGVYDTGVKAGKTAIHYRFEGRGKELWMQVTGQQMIPLERHASQADRFVFKPVKAEIQFTRKDGAIVSTTLYQAGMEILAKKLATAVKAE